MEYSFGIIPVRLAGELNEVFLVQLASGNHWGFPKGHRENSELPLETAKRELLEETALCVESLIQEIPLVETYSLSRNGSPVDKRVEYFLAFVSGDMKIQEGEILNGGWFSLEKAESLITYPSSKAVFKELKEVLALE